ncbi:homocysteine S-methyltransferase family protein [Aquibium sp. LZ166]|uniref:Homocysteine S-methyltransferase family protein n=1 Tax=Aquibium pacificus TaxID=3153579 RepID=A0ABV3SKD7_9HYPH
MTSIILTDGGMGQELLRRSGAEPTPLWSAKILMNQPGLVRDLHADFIRAGARVVTINSYAATPERLEREGVGDMFGTLQQRAIDLACEARDAVGTDCAVAGCLPPLFGSYQPELRQPFDETLAIYRRIVARQAEHVDLILCETMASAEEGLAAATAACESGKPVWLSWTLADQGAPRLRSGETIADAARAVAHLTLAARMVNCSWPEAVDRAMPELSALGGTVGAYANGFTAIEPLKLGGTVAELEARADLGPDTYADFALGWISQGATIVGGCCEVGPQHIARLRDRLAEAGHDIGAFHA